MEHERYQDLQQKDQRMQEDYEKQLKAAEESKTQALEELTQLYEARLQEKTLMLAQVSQEEQEVEVEGTPHETSPVLMSTLILNFFCVAQCQEDAQQQIREFKEIIKQVEEDEERKIHDIQIKYERRLHTEKETNTHLKGETGIMTQKVRQVFNTRMHLFLSLRRPPVSLLCNLQLFVLLLPFGGWLCDHSSTVCRDRSTTGAQK